MTPDPDARRAPLQILIAEDNQTDRMILQAIVSRQGHDVIIARDGIEAVEAFHQHRPQMVLLDAMMPRMDGLEAARQIKAAAGEELVPIIFLTSLTDAKSLAACLEVGGDDFLSKPYNRLILKAKIDAFARMRALHQSLQHQRDLIRQRNEQLTQEQTLARRVFDNIAHQGCLGARNIRFEVSPMSIFNGDVLFASPKPAGGMHLFLGDFTGHGLPAAIGAMPVSEIFYGMTAKGFPISDILREMNRKLRQILPTGFFCCAAMVDLNLQTGHAEVWNGGIPDGYLLRLDGSREALLSRHMPLGVMTAERFSAACERYSLAVGERILFCSDGIMESVNDQGEMYGEQRLKAAIDEPQAPGDAYDQLLDEVRQFRAGAESEDDITVLEVSMPEPGLLDELIPRRQPGAGPGPSNWSFSYELRDETLAHFNPVPLLLHICMDVPGLRLFSGEIYCIVTELFNNALEHGILRLPSSLKDSPYGFSRYYSERERRLRNIASAWVSITLEHRRNPDGQGGSLFIRVEDSGDGFDCDGETQRMPEESMLSGRGIAIVRQLCHGLHWYNNGSGVEAEFQWERDGTLPDMEPEE